MKCGCGSATGVFASRADHDQQLIIIAMTRRLLPSTVDGVN